MRAVALAGLAGLLMIGPASAQQPASCETERRALDMLAAKLGQDRSAFELQAVRTLADLEAQVKALRVELERARAKAHATPKESQP